MFKRRKDHQWSSETPSEKSKYLQQNPQYLQQLNQVTFPRLTGTTSLSFQTEKPSPPELELSFSSEVIVGYRVWKVLKINRRGGVKELRLAAIGVNAMWKPYEASVADCNQYGGHESPWPSCRCGYWALKGPMNALRTYEAYSSKATRCQHNSGVGWMPNMTDPFENPFENPPKWAWGEVNLWGRVLECKNGYRAEKAYPRRLIATDQETATELARVYGIPVSAHSDLGFGVMTA